ncbi:MAG: hypothetical protein U0797_22960 [Gemmataceae bacterium]
MKRFLLVASLALAASAGSATRGQAGGAFGLFYCPKYCASYCQACCPFNAFSSNGCLMQCGSPCGQPCCPPPAWPMTGWGCGGCGAFGACGAGGCGTGPCCRNPAPHAMHLVQSSPQQLGPVCCHGCGMDTYGTGGLGFKGDCGSGCCKGKGCKGGACGGEGGCGFNGGPVGYPAGPGLANPVPGHSSLPSAPFWTANMNPQQAAGNFTQPVSYQGYYYPGSQMLPNWGYGYGYYPNYAQPNYNPAMWAPYGSPRGW